MRRKSERTASKKGKASPEKKVEKAKRTRTRRRKQSSSSDNDSADEGSPVPKVETVPETEKKPPQTPVKEDSPEESQDQVWRVKTSEGSGDVGDIKKLKICLTRPPSTPERVDRSPRSKRKHSRATSSSDTPSVEGPEEKKKSKHRSKRATRDLRDELGKDDSHGEEAEDTEPQEKHDGANTEVSQSEVEQNTEPTETPMSTTGEEAKPSDSGKVSESNEETNKGDESTTESQNKISDADTTVVSPKDDTRQASSPVQQAPNESNSETQVVEQSNIPENSPENNKSDETDKPKDDESRESFEKSEILELHAEESKCDITDYEENQSKEVPKEDDITPQEEKATLEKDKVSNEENISKDTKESVTENNKVINKTNVVESSDNVVKERDTSKLSVDSGDNTPPQRKHYSSKETETHSKDLQRTDSTQSTKSTSEQPIANGQAAPVVRKRRWGARTSRPTSQKTITISTDILKDIIPDVKLVEFEEVIEDKKHKREVTEKFERPILPKIVIDNTENIEQKKGLEEKDNKEAVKPRDLAANRKISIIKDNESIIARPPSPPRNKQSCILYITNLVRPFTLLQLKNLLQRTGRIVENGFWIDRIKSKCFVQYESEDQAVETRHALHGVTWPVSNPKTLQVDFSSEEAFERAKTSEETDTAPVSTIPGTVEDWLREQDMKRERGELEKPWERKASTREWDLGKNEKDKDKDKLRRDERPVDKRRNRSPEKSPEPARKFKKKEEEAPAKLLDDLFRKTKTTPCIYWLPLSAETIAIKEEQRRQHMAEHERRLQELRRHRRH